MSTVNKLAFVKAFTMGAFLANSATAKITASKEEEEGSIYASLVKRCAEHILDKADERDKMRRELISEPKPVDLRGHSINGVSPHHNVIKILLASARQYGAPITKLTLLNAQPNELNEILSHEDAQYIHNLEWTYASDPLIDDMNAYDLTGKADIDDAPLWTINANDNIRENQDIEIDIELDDDRNARFDDGLLGAWLNDAPGARPDEALDDERVPDLLRVVIADAPAGRHVTARENRRARNIHLHTKQPYLKRMAARGRHAPLLHELFEKPDQETNITPPKKGFENNILEIKDEHIHPSSWNITLAKDVKENSDSQNPDLINLTNHKPHNLVNIFCRGNQT